jgi:hypothetical protein
MESATFNGCNENQPTGAEKVERARGLLPIIFDREMTVETCLIFIMINSNLDEASATPHSPSPFSVQ